MKRRTIVAVAVLAAWAAGVTAMVRREIYRPHVERLAEAALRVTPAAVFYAVMLDEQQVGFASSTLDTAETLIEQRDYLVVDVLVDGKPERVTARTTVSMTRTLRVRTFEVSVDSGQSLARMQGEVSGDSVLKVSRVTETGTALDTREYRIGGPILLPTLVPLAAALENTPGVGRRYVMPVFDPAKSEPRDILVRVRAESSFVVNDSSVFDSTAGLWTSTLPVTIRAWRLEADSSAAVGGWVDEQGRLVASSQRGFELRRLPYEVAFENWRRESDAKLAAASPKAAVNRDIREATIIASNKRLPGTLVELRARLSGIPLDGLDLTGGRQRLEGNLLIVTRESNRLLAPRYFPIRGFARARWPELQKEPFLEVDHREIEALAQRLAGRSRDPRVIVRRINSWVFDSVRKEVTIGIPSALHVLHTRAGDVNEHTQLFVALSRAAGVPARVATGLVYLDGKFYYHSWPEVLLRGWVAVDPTFGQFPADAAHIRFVSGGLGRQTELLRLVGQMKIQVTRTR